LIIVFWSPLAYAGRKTSNLLLMAYEASKSGEQLLVHADSRGSGPEHFLLSGNNRNRMLKQKEFGLELLERLMRCNRFEKSTVINCAYSFFDHRVHVLPPGNLTDFGEDKERIDTWLALFQRLSMDFQNVWVEAPAGRSEFSDRLCKMADLVVINLAQSPVELAKINEIVQYPKELFLIGAYEQKNAYSVHNLEQLYPRLKKKCLAVPFMRSFSTYTASGRGELFIRGRMERFFDREDAMLFREMEQSHHSFLEAISGETELPVSETEDDADAFV